MFARRLPPENCRRARFSARSTWSAETSVRRRSDCSRTRRTVSARAREENFLELHELRARALHRLLRMASVRCAFVTAGALAMSLLLQFADLRRYDSISCSRVPCISTSALRLPRFRTEPRLRSRRRWRFRRIRRAWPTASRFTSRSPRNFTSHARSPRYRRATPRPSPRLPQTARFPSRSVALAAGFSDRLRSRSKLRDTPALRFLHGALRAVRSSAATDRRRRRPLNLSRQRPRAQSRPQ